MAEMELPRYISHKKVWALEIASVAKIGTDSTTDENPLAFIAFVDARYASITCSLRGKPTPEAGWYYIVYQDGYTSFSPAKQFEEGYSSEEKTHGFGIGQAVKEMQNGRLVARKGWNGTGMFLLIVLGSRFKVNRAPLNGIFPEGTDIDYRPHVDMRTSDGSIVPWNCSQSDLLAMDWHVVTV